MTQLVGVRSSTWVAVLGAMLLTSCAGVNFYSDSALTKKTGIPIYGAKPYVLVSRTKNKDKPVEVTVEYITDRSQVIYADPRSGFGSADLKLQLDHGQLTQFGQVTDTKIPELITAVSGLLTSRATAAKDFATADQIRRTGVAGTEQAAKIPDAETVKAMRSLLNDMSNAKATQALTGLLPSEKETVDTVQKNLASILGAIDKPENAGLIPTYGDQLIESAKAFAKLQPDPAAPSARTTALQLVTAWKPRLDAIVAKITPDEASDAPDFELYEIIQNGPDVALRRVK